jgi:PAS domain-containing protein
MKTADEFDLAAQTEMGAKFSSSSLEVLRVENERLARRIAELESNAAEEKQSRRAALNLMEDAVEPRHEVEGLNRDLQREIVYRQQLEMEERRIAERYRTLFEMVPVAVYTTDAEGVIQEFNQHATEIWGLKPKAGRTNFPVALDFIIPTGGRWRSRIVRWRAACAGRKSNLRSWR